MRYSKLIVTLVLGAMFAVMTGCETMEGAGRDIERSGEGLQDAARDAKD